MPDSNIEQQLLRLHVLLGDDATQLEEVYQRFQTADPKRTGSLKTTSELKSVLDGLLSPKDLKRIDFEKLADRFPTIDGRFGYTAFCTALQRPLLLQSESRRNGSQSPTKQRVRSPTKQQQREQGRMRIDKRLESQRLIMESVRNKLLRGIQGGDCEGYQGILKALHRLDTDCNGYLDAHVFSKKIVQRLNCPMTRAEREFLLGQLRAFSTEKDENVFDYKQIGRICSLDSDDSVSEGETEHESLKTPSPTKIMQLGSSFLSAEKRLKEFLCDSLVDSNHETQSKTNVGTPRCLFTGAEKFLEIAEEIDQDNTGFLHEHEFPQILSRCGVDISPDLLTGMLSRFPRSAGKFIRYSDFLQRFGQNPQCTRGRRELKQLIFQILSRLRVPTTEWLEFLSQRFERYDDKIHGTIKNTLPTDAFLRAVQGRSNVLKLSTEEAAQVTSLFIRSSPNSSTTRLHYIEFLKFVDECHRTLSIDTPDKVTASRIMSPTSPKATQLSQPEATSESMDEIDTSDMSVGDYVMYHATRQERRNFEKLMEMLQSFQETIEDGNAQEAKIQRIADGIMMPLGKRLGVKVQFSLND